MLPIISSFYLTIFRREMSSSLRNTESRKEISIDFNACKLKQRILIFCQNVCSAKQKLRFIRKSTNSHSGKTMRRKIRRNRNMTSDETLNIIRDVVTWTTIGKLETRWVPNWFRAAINYLHGPPQCKHRYTLGMGRPIPGHSHSGREGLTTAIFK